MRMMIFSQATHSFTCIAKGREGTRKNGNVHSENNHIFKNILKTALQKTNKTMCPGED